MRKSVKGFILGLVGGLGGLLVGWYAFVIIALFGALVAKSATAIVVITFTVCPWLYIIVAGVSIIASIICLRWARFGGILLLIIAGIMLLLPVGLMLTIGKELNFIAYMFLFLPILFITLAGISAVKAKPKVVEAV